jgi:hypothetical protein
MTYEKYCELFPYSFHDGCANHAKYQNRNLELVIMRCPGEPKNEEDRNSRYLKLMFTNVTDVWIWNNDKSCLNSNMWEEMWISVGDSEISDTLATFLPNYVGESDFIDGRVVYDECIRFKCNDIIILESRALRENDE